MVISLASIKKETFFKIEMIKKTSVLGKDLTQFQQNKKIQGIRKFLNNKMR